MDFIKDLFYGNLHPSARAFSSNSAYGKAISDAAECQEILKKALDDTQKLHFTTLINAQDEILYITAYESFLDGFLLGANFVKDTFLTEHDRMFKSL